MQAFILLCAVVIAISGQLEFADSYKYHITSEDDHMYSRTGADPRAVNNYHDGPLHIYQSDERQAYPNTWHANLYDHQSGPRANQGHQALNDGPLGRAHKGITHHLKRNVHTDKNLIRKNAVNVYADGVRVRKPHHHHFARNIHRSQAALARHHFEYTDSSPFDLVSGGQTVHKPYERVNSESSFKKNLIRQSDRYYDKDFKNTPEQGGPKQSRAGKVVYCKCSSPISTPAGNNMTESELDAMQAADRYAKNANYPDYNNAMMELAPQA